MSTAIYKPEQGYWTRTMSAVAFGVIGLAGGGWLYQETAGLNTYLRGSLAAGFMIIMALLIYWVFGLNRKAVEFFIATEGELKKVNWSTRREIFGQTWVVIGVSIIISLILLTADLLFTYIFQQAGVLQV